MDKKAYDYDDVVIVPRPSDVESRDSVDISVTFGNGFSLPFPLVASPMRGITNADFGVRLAELGGLAVLHRFYDSKSEHLLEVERISKAKRFGLSLGIIDSTEMYEVLLGYRPDILVIDVANGYLTSLLSKCEKVKKLIEAISPKTLLMSGNVVTKLGVDNLYDSGVDIARVGIGCGAECSTTNITGIGFPVISSIYDCASTSKSVYLCADGGIKNSGDFVKAIVAGADFGMAGALFAQTYESVNDGIIYGQASKRAQEMRGTQIKSVEGFERIITKTMSLQDFVKEFSYGVKSAGTYLSARHLNEFSQNGKFVEAGRNTIKKVY